jgi:hypothetical protein
MHSQPRPDQSVSTYVWGYLLKFGYGRLTSSEAHSGTSYGYHTKAYIVELIKTAQTSKMQSLKATDTLR